MCKREREIHTHLDDFYHIRWKGAGRILTDKISFQDSERKTIRKKEKREKLREEISRERVQ